MNTNCTERDQMRLIISSNALLYCQNKLLFLTFRFFYSIIARK